MLLIAMMVLTHICNDTLKDYMWVDPGERGIFEISVFLTDLIFGLFLALVSIIIVKNLLRYAPELANGRPVFVTISAFCISAALCEILRFGTVVLDEYWSPDDMLDIFGLISGLVGSLVGSAITCAIFLFNTRIGFLGPGFDRLIQSNLPPEDEEIGRNSIRELITQGESAKLEFKSTLRTNLVTGEKDARMERAVLKTIVAFLNSRGGTLLIGVSDSGEIIGTDEASFESRDKMLLHLNHLIEDRIGKEYIAYINYYIVDFDG